MYISETTEMLIRKDHSLSITKDEEQSKAGGNEQKKRGERTVEGDRRAIRPPTVRYRKDLNERPNHGQERMFLQSALTQIEVFHLHLGPRRKVLHHCHRPLHATEHYQF